MENSSLVPHILNIGISLLVTGSIFWILKRSDSSRLVRILDKLHYESDALGIPFIRAALYLWAARSAGHALVHVYLSFRVAQNIRPLDWSDPKLILLADLFTVISVWTWLTVLRGPAHKNLRDTFVQMLAVWAILVPVDLILATGHRHLMLIPSLVLNILSAVFAIAAAYFRYREHSFSFIVGFTCYNLLQIPAYDAAWYGNPEPERWIYYALALGKLFNFLLIVDLLLGNHREQQGMPVLSFLKKLWRYVPIAAIIALTVVLIEHQQPWLKDRPLFATLTIFVPAAVVVLDLLSRLRKRRFTIRLTEDEYSRVRSRANRRKVSPEDLARALLLDDGD